MFGFFGSGNKLKRLEKQYRKLLEESHALSSVNRARSDMKRAEAEEVLKKIDAFNSHKD